MKHLVLIEADELKEMLRQLIREELKGLTAPDEIGRIELAERITGLKADTIYKKVANREIPFYQGSKAVKLLSQ